MLDIEIVDSRANAATTGALEQAQYTTSGS
jgi:hypothetical protein